MAQAKPTDNSPPEDNGRLGRLNQSMEEMIVRFNDDIIPRLKQAGFNETAQRLRQHIDRFDQRCAPPHSTEGLSAADLRHAYDQSGKTLAHMCGALYHQISGHCDFANHHDLLVTLRDAMQDFNRVVPSQLKTLGLEYHEFESLTLELEAKLGLDAPAPDDGRPAERRRNLPKDPDRIEQALHTCLEKARELRPMIHREERRHKLDKITGDVGSILANLPQGDDERSRGRRISALVSASAKILKVEKWVRDVNLLETERSESRKHQILSSFRELKSLAQGQEPGQGR